MDWDGLVLNNLRIFEVDLMEVTFTPLSMVKGNTKYVQIKMVGLDTALEGAYFTVKNSLDDANPLFQKTLSDGITQDTGDEEVYTVRVAPEDTASLPDLDLPAVQYWYDFTIEADGDVYTPLIGTLDVVKGTTEV